MSLSRLKAMEPNDTKTLYRHPANCLIALLQKEHINKLCQSIELIEKSVLAQARELPCYQKLLSLPGVGRVLGLTITMEVGEISRFKTPGQFASYCRTVNSQRLSNNKKKGDNNRKCGNKYLAWAFVEAANFARQHHAHCRRWFDRKAARTSKVIATKALACKLAKAAWYLMSQGSDYDPERMCPEGAMKEEKLKFVRAAASQKIGVGKNPFD